VFFRRQHSTAVRKPEQAAPVSASFAREATAIADRRRYLSRMANLAVMSHPLPLSSSIRMVHSSRPAGSKPGGPKSMLSAMKIGKWLCPSTSNGGFRDASSGGTEKAARSETGSPKRSADPVRSMGNSEFGMMGPKS
jgi:hypothetical protein